MGIVIDQPDRPRVEVVGPEVLILYDDSAIDGLTVMVGEGKELVFANIAGRIDLELIGRLATKLNVPGLEELTGGHWKSDRKKRRERHER